MEYSSYPPFQMVSWAFDRLPHRYWGTSLSAHYSVFCAQRPPEIYTIVIVIKELNFQVIHQLLHYCVVISYLYVSASF